MGVNDNISIRRVFDVIKEIADKHEMLADNDVGAKAHRGMSNGQEQDETPRELDFPYLFTDVAGVDLVVGQSKAVQSKIYRINLFVCDKHSDNSENDVDIMSDTESILTDLVMYITQSPELRPYIIEAGTTQLTPSRHVTIHECYGFECTLSIKVKADICYNLLPFEGNNC